MSKKSRQPVRARSDGGKRGPDPAFRPFGALKTMRDELQTADAKKAPKTAKAPRLPAEPAATSTAGANAEDEALTLYRMMSGVTPLGGKAATRLPRSQVEVSPSNLDARRAEAEAPMQAEEEAVRAHLRALVEGGGFEVQDDGRRVEGRRHGVTPDTVRKLRRGYLPIDARLDLHGETAVTAPQVLEQFLRAQRTRASAASSSCMARGSTRRGRSASCG